MELVRRRRPRGGENKIIEADTTYIGGKEKNKHVGKRNARNIGGMGKQIVHTLVERARSLALHPEREQQDVAPDLGQARRPQVDAHDGYRWRLSACRQRVPSPRNG